MNNTTNTQSGERLSFFKLFTQKKYRISIPIIQRDYAQGRKSTKEIRNTFLNALYNYLEENKPNRDLDFIYGSLSEINNDIDFIPLDGQQRLTTLFLLHWYLCQVSNNIEKREEFKNALLSDDGKSMFTYETRTSSSEFCSSLMKCDFDFDKLLESDKDAEGNSKENSISKTLRNYSWFYMSWQNDPTIQAMLIMLDAIHSKFFNKKEFFERLLDVDNPIITFLFLNLQDFKLTDDLYIKMNSRGIPLTSFENFKAKFEQFLESVQTKRNFSLTFAGKQKNVSIQEYFSYNIDAKWADLFWNYRKLQNRSKNETDNTFDDELMNFIKVIFTSQYAMKVNLSSKERDNSLEYLLGTNVAKKIKDYSDVISFNKYGELKAISMESVLYLTDAFDTLANGNEKIKHYLGENYVTYFDEDEVFENALKDDFESNHERLSFHAYIRFLISNKNDFSGINQWMRVIHNLTHPDNTIIDNATRLASAIQSIEKLLPQSNNILNHLQSNPAIDLFSPLQVKEEKIKAYLIIKSNDWKKKIEEVEKHGYFNGQIGFILEFAGILKYYNTNKNCNWDSQEDKEYFKIFCNYTDKASKVFEKNYENRINNKDYIFERAVLTKGDYLTTASQNRKNILSTNLVKNNIKRDHSWKRLLRISEEDQWIDRRLLVKEVFDDERFNKNTIQVSLNSICQDTTNTWRDYFISCPSLIEYCKQGFIRFENEHYILLYGESQINHKHTEMYTYYLWKNFIEPNKDSFEPFEKKYYNIVKGINDDDDPCIVFNNFCFNRIHYQIQIYYCNNDNLPYPYEIAFRKSKGDNTPENYGSEIKVILNESNFIWNEEYSGYFFTSDNSNDLINKLKQLTEKLKEIAKA